MSPMESTVPVMPSTSMTSPISERAFGDHEEPRDDIGEGRLGREADCDAGDPGGPEDGSEFETELIEGEDGDEEETEVVDRACLRTMAPCAEKRWRTTRGRWRARRARSGEDDDADEDDQAGAGEPSRSSRLRSHSGRAAKGRETEGR